VLSPTNPSTPWVLGVVLLGLLVLLVVRAIRKDKREYRRFKRMRATKPRQLQFRRWVTQSFLLFGISSLVVIALAGQFIPLLLDDVNQWNWVASARLGFERGGALSVGILVAVIVLVVGGAVGGIILARKETEIPSLGDVQALLPRNRAELRWGAALSLNAGLVEELLFRLALPAALFGITGSALAAILVSLVIFGLLHVYQGVAGIVGSLIIGTLLMVIYLASGSIWIAILAHALVDLRSLVLIPVVLFKVHRVR